MAGKPLTQTDSKAVAFAIDHLTKNQMADMLLNLAVKHLGVRDPGDGAVLGVLQSWLEPIVRARGDALVKLPIKHRQYVEASDLLRSRQ